MKINKNAFLCMGFFIIYSTWSFYLYGTGLVGDFLVTPYDELRFLEATNRIIMDFKAYGLIYVFENYYNYSQSVHFGHYFVLAFIRFLSNDSMFFWSMYHNFIFCIGVYFFSKYLSLEYKFISIKSIKFASVLVFLYPVFYYLNFSLMRDISIFSLLSIVLYLYKKNNYYLLLLFLLILSVYRVNVVLCMLLYILIDQLKGKNILSIFKYIFASFAIIVFFDYIAFGIIFRNLGRINFSNFSNFINETLVLFFSPLPFSIDPMLPAYLIFWFKVSFFVCIFAMCINIFVLIRSKFTLFVPVVPMIFFILLYVFIYSTEVGVGFRQASIVLPFIYIPILFYIFHLIKYKTLSIRD
ncbi:hypothetical protein M5F03_04730 [Acinetobacter sp. ANC 5579]|uniref:hypothetical protein n=1 Tax=Acinetobacter amyesii TaxID=2942470 RepID=UPI0020C087B0|nr:hypothetical protein [Acinetobacter amyesii]MCL6234476.1 hypothetical protein [Acinetobacter amyesii]